MVLLSLIVLALMTVFSSTQAVFRASVTQADVLGGGRTVMGLMKNDFESLTPSFGASNGAVNFCAVTNWYQYQSNSAPLVQSLAGSGYLRTNVLEYFFLLTRQNTTWTGTGYFVDTASTNYLNPLYRFSMSTNAAADPAALYQAFVNTIYFAGWTNMSHLADGVVQLTVRPYDINGRWMTNFYTYYGSNPVQATTNRNAWFSVPQLGEVGFYLYSNTLPGSVEIQLGLLEDRTLQRAQSISGLAQSNYLALQSGKVHLFRQRLLIRNVDPSAYQ